MDGMIFIVNSRMTPKNVEAKAKKRWQQQHHHQHNIGHYIFSSHYRGDLIGDNVASQGIIPPFHFLSSL